MTIESRPYGQIEISERQVIHFPVGIYGFGQLHEYALLDSGQPPFYWLQSLENAGIAFVMINPYVLRPDYVLDIPGEDLEAIQYESEEDILVFAIVTIPEDETKMSANLQGPVVINRVRQLGRQAISLNQQWRTKHYIIEELAGAGSR
jgi:flagellar assembly factor FliW